MKKIASVIQGKVSSAELIVLKAFYKELQDFRRKKPEEVARFMKDALARSEKEAIELLRPLFQVGRTFKEGFKVYRPAIVEMKKHFCRKGRPDGKTRAWSGSSGLRNARGRPVRSS